MTICLEATRLTKSFGSIEAVQDVSLALEQGEVVALVGDNGAGKSTLMNMLCGATRPDTGAVSVQGEDVTSLDHARQLGVGMVYQDLALAADLNVAENMFLGRELRRRGLLGRLGWLDREAMRSRARRAVLELGGTVRSVDAPVASLSGGQRQITAVARTIMEASTAVLLDEPTAALGPKQVQIVIDAIRNAAANGLGVMIVSHDVPHMLEVADRILVLRRGRLVLDRAAREMKVAAVVNAMVGEDLGAPL